MTIKSHCGHWIMYSGLLSFLGFISFISDQYLELIATEFFFFFNFILFLNFT